MSTTPNVPIEVAQTKLAELIDHLRAGDEVVITKNDRPIACLVPAAEPAQEPRRLGTLRGTVTHMADDSGAPPQTDQGRLVPHGAQPGTRDSTDPHVTDPQVTDPQVVDSPSVAATDLAGDTVALAPDELLAQLKNAGPRPSPSLICTVELTRFDAAQREELLPLLWRYIVDYRDRNDRAELIAVAAAIRKYIATMPMNHMGDLAKLLETGNRSPVPIELEIEITKMVYRNFEVHPPSGADPHPELAERLWEMAQAYINPRLLSRDKYSAAASLAIDAIVAMRSSLAEPALHAAAACPYRWFGEIVSDDLDRLRDKWTEKSPDAAAWLVQMKSSILAQV